MSRLSYTQRFLFLSEYITRIGLDTQYNTHIIISTFSSRKNNRIIKVDQSKNLHCDIRRLKLKLSQSYIQDIPDARNNEDNHYF